MTTKKIKAEKAPPPAHADPVVRGYVGADGKEWVRVKYRGKSALVEYRLCVSGMATVCQHLADRGVILVSKSTKSCVVEQVESLSFTTRRIFSQPGWRAGQFANVSGKVFAPKNTAKGLVAFKTVPTKCARSGTHKEWLQAISEPLAGHLIPSFFLMVPFAAPLLDIVGRTDNFGFEIYGPKRKGKTTVQRLMASVVGPAMDKAGGYMSSFRTTENALERTMAQSADMVAIFEEANLYGTGEGTRTRDRMMQDFAMLMGSGQTKKRLNGEGEQEGYSLIFATSTNKPFREAVDQAHQEQADAALDRLYTISVPDTDAGVFGALPEGFSGFPAFATMLEDQMKLQHGTAMPRFLKRLVARRHKDETGLREALRWDIEQFQLATGNPIKDSTRASEAFGLIYAAGKLAQKFKALPQSFDCLAAALECYTNFLASVPVRQSLEERLVAIADRPETLAIDSKKLPRLSDEEMAAHGAFIRKIKGVRLLLMTTEFGKRKFRDWNALSATPDFIALNRAGKDKRGRGYRCQIRSNKKSDWFYCFELPD